MPAEHVFIAPIIGKLRNVCASKFLSIDDARCAIEAWGIDNNMHRLSISFGQIAPGKFLRRSNAGAN
jgi:hypothetical protein